MKSLLHWYWEVNDVFCLFARQCMTDNIEKILYKKILSKKTTRKKLFEYDFREFCKYYFEANFYYPYSEYHEEYAEVLEQWLDLFFLWHRESAKTTIARWYVVRCIAYEKHPFITRMSYNKLHAKSNVYYISQELIENTKIVRDFGQLYLPEVNKNVEKKKKKIKTVEAFIAENGVLVRAVALKTSVRWFLHNYKWRNVRPSLVMFDDIDTEASVKNPKVIDWNYRFLKWEVFWWLMWWAQKVVLWNVINEDWLMPRLENEFAQSKWRWYFRVPTINHTYWSTIVNWIIRDHNIGETNRDRFVHTDKVAEDKNKEFQADTWYTNITPFVSLNKLLTDQWPTAYWQNHLLKPYIDWTVIIKKQRIQRVDSMWPNPNTYTTTLWIDPAFSKKTNTDPIWMVLTRKRNLWWTMLYFVVYSCELKWEEKQLSNIKDKVRRIKTMFGFDNISIEWNNWWEIIGEELQDEWYAVLIEHTNLDKISSLRAYEADFHNKCVFFRNHEDTMPLYNQLTKFPNVDNDDMVDWMLQSFKHWVDIEKEMKTFDDLMEKYWVWKNKTQWIVSEIWGRF